ncbi:MAG: endoribonuclease MazF [Chloroflexota bacterium]|nr:endoribonuclease MazF [Chloroflexota bacterium]MDE2946242.1 endoribonuclease MazF [Chloroflexota bacterium]
MAFIPDRGDIVWTDFDPQAGREQAGSRPALILSRQNFNAASGLAVCCPITGRQKGYPFEIPLPAGLEIYGVVLVDHIRSIDWRVRPVEFKAKAPESVLHNVLDRLETLLQ